MMYVGDDGNDGDGKDGNGNGDGNSNDTAATDGTDVNEDNGGNLRTVIG
jgi:hypothetical protein